MTTRACVEGMKARFFCANCSTEVGPRTKRCPSCGKFFSAVTCPSCGYEGGAENFLKGCPVCGYLVSEEKKGMVVEGDAVKAREESAHFSPVFYRIVAALLVAALAALIVVLFVLNK